MSYLLPASGAAPPFFLMHSLTDTAMSAALSAKVLHEFVLLRGDEA